MTTKMEKIGFNLAAKTCDCCGMAINGAVVLTDGNENFHYALSCASFETGIAVNVLNSEVRREIGLKDRPINIGWHGSR